jgi:hypothetical protein
MIPGSANPLLLAGAAAGAGGYEIERSLRFNSADSAYLSRTPASAGNRTTWTWAGWVKRSALGQQGIFSAVASNASAYTILEFGSGNQIYFYDSNVGGLTRATTAVYRDLSAWYHIVLVYNTTDGIANQRVRIYVNGIEVTAFLITGVLPQGGTGWVNNTVAHSIGSWAPYSPSAYFSGYLADVHFIDGQALTPTSFTEFDDNGVLQPKAYEGTYGTNGFYLPFSDNSTAAALGTDTSGNGNTWTVNNLSVTAGAGNDSLVDSPTNYGEDTGAGGEVRGNYCTWNPLWGSTATLSNGNLTSDTNNNTVVGTFQVSSGKWYWEVTVDGAEILGICKETELPTVAYTGASAGSYGYSGGTGNKINAGNQTAYGSAFGLNDIIGVALDLDAGELTFYKNGTSQGVAFSGLSGSFFPQCGRNLPRINNANFGQRPFAYTAPSGFKALCTQNLPEPTIADGSTAMDVVTYTGNGGVQTIGGLNFSPDLVWIKDRSIARDHNLFDTIRGTTNYLRSNATNAESTSPSTLTAFNSDGFTLSGGLTTNYSPETYVAWTWDAGSSTVTNNDGSITSQVRANASAGFSVVGYASGAAGQKTVGHGLNAAPSLIITKSRTNATFNWVVYHASVTDTTSKYLRLNTTDAVLTFSTVWGAALPTSTVFGITSDGAVVANTDCIAYCFAPVAGYSAFGSYVGNGNADGPFVYTGFRPRYVLIRSTSGARDWMIKDALRAASYNPQGGNLYANQALAEDTASSVYIDLLSNGFKLRGTYASINANAETFIYAAFAEHPFATSRAR